MDKGYVMLVSGYRGFENYEVFKNFMNNVVMKHGIPTLVLQGECKTGTDQLAKRWCIEMNFKCEGTPADWSVGRRAGPERNTIMLNRADIVCAFLHENSKGTRDVIVKAKKQKSKILYVLDIK